MTSIKEGWLEKQGGGVKSWRERYFVMDDDAKLRYYEKQPVAGTRAKGVIDLVGCEVRAMGRVCDRHFLMVKRVNGGRLFHNHDELLLAADGPAAQTAWLLCLTQMCRGPRKDSECFG
eukprot:Rmarinus@m.17820